MDDEALLNRMILTSSKAINLIRMVGQDDPFW